MKKNKTNLSVSAIILLASGLVCKILGALFRFPLTSFLGIEGIGVFQLVMSLYLFALVITSGGVTTSLSKLISSARAKSDYSKIYIFLYRAIFISVAIGIFIGAIFLLLGKFISALQGVDAYSSYMLFIFLLPLGAGLSALRGFFQGFENMLPTAISQVIEQVFKFAFGLLFAYYFSKFGGGKGVFGAFVGIVFSELISLLYLSIYFLIKNKKQKRDVHRNLNINQINRNLERSRNIERNKEILFARKQFDKANFTLMLSASIFPLVNAFDGLFIVSRLVQAGMTQSLATELYGLQTGIVGSILNFPLIISIAMTTTLLPNISFLFSRGSGGRWVVEKGLKILLFFILPTTFGIVALSRQLFTLFFPNLSPKFLDVANGLTFYGGFSVVLTALMQYFVMLLQADGEFGEILLYSIVGGTLKALISLIFSAIPTFNIYALVLGNIILSSTVALLSLMKLKKRIFFSLKFFDVFDLLFSCFVMFVTVYFFIKCNYFSAFANIIVGIIIGGAVYLILTTPFLVRLLPKLKRNKMKNHEIPL